MARKLPGLARILGGDQAAAGDAGGSSEPVQLIGVLHAMDRAGVRTSLVVLQEEVAEFFRLAGEHPGRLYGLAYFDPFRPAESLERLRALCERHPPSLAGVHTAVPEDGPDPRDRALLPLYEYCLMRGLPIQFRLSRPLGSGQDAGSMALAVLASSYPALKIVCLGGDASPLTKRPRVLRQLSNLFFEAGGLGEDDTARAASELRSVVGSRRLLFGSGWPVGQPSYPGRVAALRRFFWWQRQHIAWRTARRIYGPRILGGRPAPVRSISE